MVSPILSLVPKIRETAIQFDRRALSSESTTLMVAFDEQFRQQLRELLIWRRDVRRFRTDPLPDGTLERLIDIACLSPSVGLSQPWRFVIVEDPVIRPLTLARPAH